jgi:hypothetical protein
MKAHALPRRWEIGGLVLITLLAAALRFYRLPDLPATDTAGNSLANDAAILGTLEVQATSHP